MDNLPVNLPLQSSSTPGQKPQLMLVVVTAVVFLIFAVIIGWSFFGLGKPKQPPPKIANQTPNSVTSHPPASSNGIRTADGASVQLPFNLQDSRVFATNLVYVFDGNILEVKKVPEGMELVTNIAVQGMSKLLLTGETRVSIWDGNNQKDGSLSDLKPNQRVRVFITNYLKTGKTTVTFVTIFLRQTASTSATPR